MTQDWRALAAALLEKAGRSSDELDSVAATLESKLGQSPIPFGAPIDVAFERIALRLGPGPVGEALARFELADLWLAAAAVRGDAVALAALEDLLAQCRQAIRRAARPGIEVDDVLQLLRERLLARGDSGPKLDAYGGEGPLLHWLRVAAARATLNAGRGPQKDEAGEARIAALIEPRAGAELAFIKREHQLAFRAAFREAFDALEPRERTVLRMVVNDGRTLDEIGAVYGKDKSTVSRWLTSARARLQEQIRSSLRDRLRLAEGELESLLRDVQSQLEVSLSALDRSSATG